MEPTQPKDWVINLPPQKPPKRERVQRMIQDKWRNRSDIVELQYFYIPAALVVAGLGVHIADEEFNTHIADRMAAVKTYENDSTVERVFDGVIRGIGQSAQSMEDS